MFNFWPILVDVWDVWDACGHDPNLMTMQMFRVGWALSALMPELAEA
jgi:hypothetical protein